MALADDGHMRAAGDNRLPPLGAAVAQVGDGWTILILWAALNGVSRFDDYQRRLGVARNILSNRLRRMVALGLLEKRPVRDGARRLEYRVTAKGEELRRPLAELRAWGGRWGADLAAVGPAVDLVPASEGESPTQR